MSSKQSIMPKSVGSVVGTFKKVVGRNVRPHLDNPEIPFWQRGYYDRIVRDEGELNRVREYIRLNPGRWANDRDNLDQLLENMDYHL
ncbi:MAG: putative transposase [Cellvibrionaceae bacterium]|jgi:putative transposase